MGVFFLFIDGLGIGTPGENNLLSNINFTGFESMTGGQKLDSRMDFISDEGITVRSIDACLGVSGFPQSGTGQATLFSGINASKIINQHFGPYPHTKNKHLLQEESLFNKLIERKYKPFFINAFPKIFFERAKLRNRWSCCTLMTKSAGLKINSEEEVINGTALTAEILQDYWRKYLNIDIPDITYKDAASRGLKALDDNHLVLMEYYLTDKAGHSRNQKDAIDALRRIDLFIHALMELITDDHTLVITSDHGNVEDISVKTHTYNPVPLLVRGKKASFFNEISDLTEITPAIIDAISVGS